MKQAHDKKLMWMKRRQMMMMSRSHDDDNSSWEDKAFAEDAAAAGSGGCIWPPRCYSCSFCKRQFRSAQALGGHMNVHRRDRARLKQQQRHSLTTLQQNLHTSLSCSRVSADQDSQTQQHHIMSPCIYKFSGPESEVENKSKREEEEEEEEHSRCLIRSHEAETDLCVGLHSDRISGACKRRKTSGISGFSFLMIKPYCSFDHHMQYSEVIPAAAGAVEDIDLELRL